MSIREATSSCFWHGQLSWAIGKNLPRSPAKSTASGLAFGTRCPKIPKSLLAPGELAIRLGIRVPKWPEQVHQIEYHFFFFSA
jgi:hypothetical protein